MPYFRYDDYSSLVTELKNKRRTITRRNKKIKKLEKILLEIKEAYIKLTTQDEYGSYYIEEANEFIDMVKNILKNFEVGEE